MSVLAALCLLVILLVTNDRLIEPLPIFSAAVPFGGLVIATTVGSHRWASDRLKDSALGQILRAVDPGEAALDKTYWITTVTGVLTVLAGLAGVLFSGVVTRTPLAIGFSVLLLLALYGLLGTLTLISLTRRINRWHAQLQGDREMLERLEREHQQRLSDDEQAKGELGISPDDPSSR